MTSYKGPHVSVKQVFEVSPNNAAVEALAPAIIGTAYDVFKDEVLGNYNGIVDSTLPWTTDDNVVYNSSVIGQKLYDFYPVKASVNSPVFGVIPSNSAIEASGIKMSKDSTYTIPGSEKIAGDSVAVLPYYKLASGASIGSDKTLVNVVGGSMATAGIVANMEVYLGGTLVGTALTVSETSIKLTKGYSSTVADTSIEIGISSSTPGKPSYLYDSTASFKSMKLSAGDLLDITTLDGTNDDMISIVNVVNDKLIRFYTASESDTAITQAKSSSITAATTRRVLSYSAKRFVGFSEISAALASTSITGIELTFANDTDIKEGDVLSGGSSANLADNLSNVLSAIDDGSSVVVIVDTEVTKDGTAVATSGTVDRYRPVISTPITSDFRSIRSYESKVVKRITSIDDIKDAWGDINVYNELAMMVFIAQQKSGGNVVYGINVDSSNNLASEYAEALEDLKLIDCYTTVFGTTSGGVNSLMSPYCLEQSEPYEAHERCGIVVYDEDDVYSKGESEGTALDNAITVVDLDVMAAGVTVGDVVVCSEAELDTIEAKVIATPDSVNGVDVDVSVTGYKYFKFSMVDKMDRAVKIGTLGIGQRRVTVLWPSWFKGDAGNGVIDLPPYYLAAMVAGMDSGIVASQDFTNYDTSIPGISKLSLNTSSYFRKKQLDEIGGGGVDVFIQETSVSSLITSRDDLTSDNSSIEFSARSVTKQADVAAKTLRAAVAPYLGKYNITPNLISFLGQVCSIVSSTLKTDSILDTFEVLSIKRSEEVINKVDFSVKAIVFIAGKKFDITMMVSA